MVGAAHPHAGRDPRRVPGSRSRHRRPATQVGVAGRVMFVRNTGKLCFATLQEGDGTQLQAMISLAGVGRTRWRPGRPTSTSVTSCSCTARSSARAAGS